MTPPRHALISITSAHATLFQGKETTGLFISEALHPYNVLTAAGFEVDLASETGSYTPDWLSEQPDFLNGSDLEIWNNADSEFRKKLDNMPRAADLDGSKYGVFYASAGHAALIDYPTATGLQSIASQVWANGGIVASVCHGPAIFANVVDKATGELVIKGKRITGFTTEAEHTMGVYNELKTWHNSEMVEELALRAGAKCTCLFLRLFCFLLLCYFVCLVLIVTFLDERSAGIWDDFHVVEGRLVTGQNPASAASTARAVVAAFEKL